MAQSMAAVFRRAEMFRALRYRGFALLWTSSFLMGLGIWFEFIARAWLVLDITENSPLALSVMSFFGTAPVLFLSLFAGSIADKFDRRFLLVLTQGTSLLGALLLGVLSSLHLIQVWHVFAISALRGFVNAFDQPVRQALVPGYVGRENVMNAIALSSAASNMTRILGPAAAGLVVGFFGISASFYLKAIVLVPAIVAILLMPRPPKMLAASESVWRKFKDGVSYLRRSSEFKVLFLMETVPAIFGIPYIVLLPFVARSVLQVGAEQTGTLMAATGIGALVGSLCLASLGNFQRKGLLLLCAAFSFGAMVLFFAASPWFWLSFVALLGVGITNVTYTSMSNTLFQVITPEELRGRTMGVYTLASLGMTCIGYLQAGALAEAYGAPLALGLGGVVIGLFILVMAVRVPKLRHMG